MNSTPVASIITRSRAMKPMGWRISYRNLQPDKPAIIRVSLVDDAAHAATFAPQRNAPGSLQFSGKRAAATSGHMCQQNRRLTVTTDHGLSLTRNGFSHGKGGVYERAIFRAEWRSELIGVMSN